MSRIGPGRRTSKYTNNCKCKYILLSWIDVTSQKLILWEFSTHNSVIWATMFIKNAPNFTPPCLLQAPLLLLQGINHCISATASLKIGECFWFSLCTWKNKSFKCEIVINCFENIYYQSCIWLKTGVPLIRFNSIK